MQTAILGISHKIADVPFRERFSKACDLRFQPGKALHPGLDWILLSTCNRTEIYFSSEDLALSHTYLLEILRQEIGDLDFDKKIYSFFGKECFTHLVKVTAGLDSACRGETEIQGQVKKSYLIAKDAQPLSPSLHFLLQKALFLAKKIRSSLSFQKNRTALEEILWEALLPHFPFPQDQRILFVGASDINTKLSHFFAAKGCRHLSLYSESGQSIHPKIRMTEKKDWHTYDLLLFATKKKSFLLESQETNDWKEKKLLIDLSVPRVVDPSIERNPNITLYNIDQIQKNALSHADQEIVHEQVALLTAAFLESRKKKSYSSVA